MIGKTNSQTGGAIKGEKLNISLTSNQSNHDDLLGAIITVTHPGGTTQYTWEGSEITVNIPPYVEYSVEYSDVEGYATPAKFESTAVSENYRTLTGTYNTTVITASIGSNQTDKSDVANVTVTIGGKALKNGESAKFATGTALTAAFSAVAGYATPASQSITASGTAMTVSGTYNSTFVTVAMADNQSSLNDIASATATVAASGITTQTVSNGGVVKVPTGVSCTVTWNAVTDYKTPDVQTFTTSGTAVTKTGTYQTELVSVTLSADDGSSVNGATVTINGKSQTWNGTALTQKVAFGTSFTVEAGDMDGFVTPDSQTYTASQSSRNLAFVYKASAIKVNILSNQDNDTTIAAVKASLSYPIFDEDGNLNDLADFEVSNGETVNVPSNTEVTITFPEVEGYKTPDTITFTHTGGQAEKTGTYQTQLLTVNVTGSGATPSGYTVTGKNSSTGATLFAQTTSSVTHKIPWGTSYTVTPSSLDGYNAISAQTGTANSLSNTLTFTYVYNPGKDLSMYDIYGNPINRSTANCYVIREAGQYKFPLVYGNAIKNGVVNTAAFTNNGGSYSHDFVDYKGNAITSPYIEDSAFIMDGLNCAQLTISDTEGVIENIQIIDGSPCRYIQFTVVSVPNTGANAVISYLDGELEIAWNWHIWLWADDLTPVEITNSTSVAYNIMPVNLASKWDDDAHTYIKNWFYQFGRPTPLLCPSAYNSTSNHASYGALDFTTASIASNLYTGIQNPTTFYKYSSSYNYNWFSTNSGESYNLWDAACTSTGNSDNDVVKTVYDPSPVGFKMPNGNTFTGLSVISSTNGIVKMARYSGDTTGVEFPMSGYRSGSDGSLGSVGSYGSVWLSSARSQYSAYSLNFNSSAVSPQSSSYRAFGSSVRPVQE